MINVLLFFKTKVQKKLDHSCIIINIGLEL